MCKFLIFVLYLLLHPVSVLSASALKTPYAYPDLVIGTSEYYVVTDEATWEDAKAFAAELGGSLVEIDNVVENSKLYNYLKINEVGAVAPDGGGAKYVWLGGSDAAEEGQWVWPSEKSINFNEDFQTSLWGSGQGHGSLGSEPDNFDNQDCLALGMESWPVFNPGFYGEAGQWNDVDCGNKLPYVVEVDLSDHFTEIKLNSTFDKSSAKRDIQAGIALKRYSDISYTANSLGTDRLKVLGRFKTQNPKKIDVYFVIKRGNRVYQVIDGVLTAWSGSFSTLTPLIEDLVVEEEQHVELADIIPSKGADWRFFVGYKETDSDLIAYIISPKKLAVSSNPYTVKFIYVQPEDREYRPDYLIALEGTKDFSTEYFSKRLGYERAFTTSEVLHVDSSWDQERFFQIRGDEESKMDYWYNTVDYLNETLGEAPSTEVRFVINDIRMRRTPSSECNQGAGSFRITVMHSDGFKGLTGQPTECMGDWPLARYHGGQAHELGHALQLVHPYRDEDEIPEPRVGFEGCCDNRDNLLMSWGYVNGSSSELTEVGKNSLRVSPWFTGEPEYFRLKNVFSGKCIDLEWGRAAVGTPFFQYQCGTDPNFYFTKQHFSKGYYHLSNKRLQFARGTNSNSMCMNLNSNDSFDKEVLAYSCTSTDNSLWKFTEIKSNKHQIINKKNGQCLTIGEDTVDNAAYLSLEECSDEDRMLWTMDN